MHFSRKNGTPGLNTLFEDDSLELLRSFEVLEKSKGISAAGSPGILVSQLKRHILENSWPRAGDY